MANKKLDTDPTRVKTRSSNLFVFLLRIVILCTLTVFPFIFDAFTAPKLLILSSGLLLISVRFFLELNRGFVRKIDKTLYWICLIVTVVIFTSWIQTQVPLTRALIGQYGRGNGIAYYLFALLILLFATTTYSSSCETPMHKNLILLSWILSGYSVFQKFGIDVANLDTRDLSPVVLTLGNSNFSGGLLASLFCYLFVYTIVSKSYKKLELGALTFLSLGIYFANAVQGYLIMAFGIAVGISLKLILIYKSRKFNYLLFALWISAITATFLGSFGLGPLSVIFSRGSFQTRIEYWKIGIKVIQDYPWFGIGPDKLYDISASYMSPGSLQTTTATRLDNVHNWYLNFGLSFGLFALFLYLLIILRTFVSIARLKEVALQNGGIAGASTTFLAFFLDGLVSIEQPGLGIWLFLLAGVVVSAEKEFYKSSPNNNLAIRFMSNRRANLLKIILVLNSIVLLINTSMITYRIWNDAQLRSRIQAVLVGQVTNTNLTQIASYSINLRSEPEYAVKAFDPLANLGQIQKIEQISARVYEYNPESIQASLIQAKVLEVLNRDSEGCSIRRRLIRNSPWDKEQLLNYLICISKGSEDTDYKQVLRTSENFLEPLKFDESIGDKGVDELISMLLSATLHQRVYTLLNEQPRAELAKGEASKLINNIQERLTNKEVPDPTSARQYSKLLELLNSADASK